MLSKKKFVILKIVLCIAFIKCLLLQYSSAVDVTSYDFELINDLNLHSKSSKLREKQKPSKVKLHINAKLHTKPHPTTPNTFIAAFDKVDIELELLGSEQKVNLSTCKDFKKIAPTFKLPFLITKSEKKSVNSYSAEKAVFQSITVGKNDDITSVSMKRMVGMKLQVNEYPIRRAEAKELRSFNTLTVESTNYGKCRIRYVGKKKKGSEDEWKIEVHNFITYCDKRENRTNPDSEYLKGFCNSDPKKNLAFEEKGASMVDLTGEKLSYKELTRDLWGTYLPWKKAPRTELEMNIDSRLALTPSTEGVPDFDETNAETVQDNKYIPVTRRHILDDYQDDLRNIYKALACEPDYYNFYLSVFDYAIRCFEL